MKWSVAATVKEPIDVLLPFAAHHLDVGAHEIFLFFDDPDDPAFDVLSGHPRIVCTKCDQDYWAGSRGGINGRQVKNFKKAMEWTDAQWVIHIDADEFLWTRTSIAEDISRLRLHHDWMAIRPAERVWHGVYDSKLFVGDFRKPTRDLPLIRDIYGDTVAERLPLGLAGHDHYKPAVPHRSPFQTRLHFLSDQDTNKRRPYLYAPTTDLLHFDALSQDKWILKMLNYANGMRPGIVYAARWHMIRNAIAEENIYEAFRKIFYELYVLDDGQRKKLSQHDLLLTPCLRLEDSVRRHFPDLTVDFTTTSLDQELQAPLDRALQRAEDNRDKIIGLRRKNKDLGPPQPILERP